MIDHKSDINELGITKDTVATLNSRSIYTVGDLLNVLRKDDPDIQKIAMIKLFREITGLGLAESKAVVEQIFSIVVPVETKVAASKTVKTAILEASGAKTSVVSTSDAKREITVNDKADPVSLKSVLATEPEAAKAKIDPSILLPSKEEPMTSKKPTVDSPLDAVSGMTALFIQRAANWNILKVSDILILIADLSAEAAADFLRELGGISSADSKTLYTSLCNIASPSTFKGVFGSLLKEDTSADEIRYMSPIARDRFALRSLFTAADVKLAMNLGDDVPPKEFLISWGLYPLDADILIRQLSGIGLWADFMPLTGQKKKDIEFLDYIFTSPQPLPDRDVKAKKVETISGLRPETVLRLNRYGIFTIPDLKKATYGYRDENDFITEILGRKVGIISIDAKLLYAAVLEETAPVAVMYSRELDATNSMRALPDTPTPRLDMISQSYGEYLARAGVTNAGDLRRASWRFGRRAEESYILMRMATESATMGDIVRSQITHMSMTPSGRVFSVDTRLSDDTRVPKEIQTAMSKCGINTYREMAKALWADYDSTRSYDTLKYLAPSLNKDMLEAGLELIYNVQIPDDIVKDLKSKGDGGKSHQKKSDMLCDLDGMTSSTLFQLLQAGLFTKGDVRIATFGGYAKYAWIHKLIQLTAISFDRAYEIIEQVRFYPMPAAYSNAEYYGGYFETFDQTAHIITLSEMTHEIAEALIERDIRTIQELQHATLTRARRTGLAHVTGLPVEVVQYFAVQAELLKVPSMIPAVAKRLIELGIHSVKALADVNKLDDAGLGMLRKELTKAVLGVAQQKASELPDTGFEDGMPDEPADQAALGFNLGLSDVLTELGKGIGKAQRELDIQTIDVQNSILKDKELADYGMNATWYVMPEIKFDLNMRYDVTEVRSESGTAEIRKIGIIPSNIEYDSLFSSNKSTESRLSIRFRPMPAPPISIKRTEVPNLIGMMRVDAEEELSARDITAEIVDDKGFEAKGEIMTVTGQSVKPGDYLLSGDKLTVYVGLNTIKTEDGE